MLSMNNSSSFVNEIHIIAHQAPPRPAFACFPLAHPPVHYRGGVRLLRVCYLHRKSIDQFLHSILVAH